MLRKVIFYNAPKAVFEELDIPFATTDIQPFLEVMLT